jgi:signal transduction histidine kinase
VGITKADLPKLFQKFSRIQNPLSQKEGGSGLGLFLASKLAQAHGGVITVTSRPGQGSTFTFRLPLRANAARNVVQLTE